MSAKKLIRSAFLRLLRKLPATHFFDQIYALVLFWVAHRRLPRKNSGLFNDYLYFLKTSPRIEDALRQFVSDKDLVKIFYRGLLGHDYAPRTLAKYHSYDEFNRSSLPKFCIIKPSHLSGAIFVSDGRSSLTQHQLNLIQGWFQKSMYLHIGRERNYKNLQPTVIAEEVVAGRDAIRDYKIFCYRGRAGAIQVDVDRHSAHKRRMYTRTWQALDYCYNKPLANLEEKPDGLDQALSLAEEIAKNFEFIRVDTFLISGRVYLGELTSIPENAHGRFETLDAERSFMSLLST